MADCDFINQKVKSTKLQQTDLVYEALQGGDYTRSGTMQWENHIIQLDRVHLMWMLWEILTLQHAYCYSYVQLQLQFDSSNISLMQVDKQAYSFRQ